MWVDQRFQATLAMVLTEQALMVTFLEGAPEEDPTASMRFTKSLPWATRPKTTWRPSSQEVLAVVMT